MGSSVLRFHHIKFLKSCENVNTGEFTSLFSSHQVHEAVKR